MCWPFYSLCGRIHASVELMQSHDLGRGVYLLSKFCQGHDLGRGVYQLPLNSEEVMTSTVTGDSTHYRRRYPLSAIAPFIGDNTLNWR